MCTSFRMCNCKWKVFALGYARSCYILIAIDVVWNHTKNCINAANPSDALDWSTKPFSQSIVAFLTGSSRVHNIPSAQNQMADQLLQVSFHIMQ
jgi:hypothetical protein